MAVSSEVADAHVGRVGQGVAWSAVNAVVLKLAQFMVGVVVARLVAPHQFGVFVVALTIYTIANSISDIGVGSALLREGDRADEAGPTLTTIAIGMGTVIAGIMVAAARPMSEALGSADATNAVRVIALTLLLLGIGTVPSALLIRNYMQKQLFVIDCAFFLVANAVLIIMAVRGEGVMALAWSRVAGQVVATALTWILAPKRYGLGFSKAEAIRQLRFGLPLSGASLVWFTTENVDFMIIGRMRGALTLGYYNLAYNVASWPVAIFGNVLNGVALPTLSRVRQQRDRLVGHLSAALAALASTAFLVSALCLALSGPLVNTVYGHRWSDAAPILGVLGVFGSVRVMLLLLSHLMVAVGWTRRMFVLQVVWLVALVPSLVVGVYLDGAVGAAWAQVLVVALIVIPIYLVVLRRRLGLSLDVFLRSIGPPFVASVAAGVAAYVIASQIRAPWLALILGIAAGLFAYGLALNAWLARLVRQLRRLYGRSAGPELSSADIFPITHGRHRASQRNRAFRLMPRSRHGA